jgi:DNA gyrase subunit B
MIKQEHMFHCGGINTYMTKSYEVNDIQVLDGLDAVRLRPGMYIGTTGLRGLHHLLSEIVDNGMDEAANGYATTIEVVLNRDKSITVIDDGRGIPVGIHDTMKMPGVQVVFTQLHSGGKFNTEHYNYSGGLHGVGAAVVNALSRWLEVEVYRDGMIYYQRFESKEENGSVHAGKPVTDLEMRGSTDKQGTKITFLPDDRIFDDIEMKEEIIAKRLKELAFLNKGIKMIFKNNRTVEPASEIFYYSGGLVDFVKYLNEDKSAIHSEVIYFEGERDGIKAQIAIQYTDSYTESIFSYVNNIPTSEGGTHEIGFKAGVTRVLNDFVKKQNLYKGKNGGLIGEDFREGMTAVISVKMNNVQFEGQTKTKLGNTEARTAIESIVSEGLQHILEDIDNQSTLEMILNKAISTAMVREAARKAKDLTRKKNSLESAPLVGKLASCTGRNPKINELFIVEGDSAGGSAKQGRDRQFQAILPLRGKPLNVEKKRLDQVLANEEFRTIISALGTGIDEDFDINKLKYDKVIILSDADQDGAHIRAILLTFFFRYMKELIANGHVYIGMAPLYKIEKGDKIRYVYSDEELKKCIKEMGRGYTLQRYKGLGEMNPEQLWETTMNPVKRSIVRVSIEDAAEAEKLVTILMGDKIDSRRQYITTYANFNRQDIFQEMGV